MQLSRNVSSMLRIFSGKKFILIAVLIVAVIIGTYHYPFIKNRISEHRLCYTYFYHLMPNMSDEVKRLLYSKTPGDVTSKVHVFKSSNNRLESTTQSSIVMGTLKTLAGPVNIYTYGYNDIFVSSNILKYHDWEGEYRKCLERLFMAEPDLHFLDFGTNIGVFALTAAKHNRYVVAVDANRMNLELLSRSLGVNKNFSRLVTLIHNALSNEHGKVVLNVNPWNVGGSSVSKVDANREATKAVVDAVPTDELIPIIPFKRAILKMDIEAFEHMAMAGATQLFEKIDIPYVLMEWNGQMGEVYKRKHFIGAAFLYHFFKDRGYVPYHPTVNVRLPDYFCMWTSDVFFKRQNAHKKKT